MKILLVGAQENWVKNLLMSLLIITTLSLRNSPEMRVILIILKPKSMAKMF